MPSPNTLFLQAAIEEARKGLDEGGIPIGSVLVIDNQIVGRGHNRRVQKGSAILHAEMDALENAGRLTARDYRRSVLYSTLSPCDMCSGTALLYQIPRIVIGENRTFQGPEEYVRSRGVVLEIVDDPECVQMMKEFIRSKPELWNEDIGELKIAQSDSNPPTISLSRKPLALLTGRSRCRSAGCDLRRGDAIVASLGTGQANRLLRV
jgi:cytosine deaminase